MFSFQIEIVKNYLSGEDEEEEKEEEISTHIEQFDSKGIYYNNLPHIQLKDNIKNIFFFNK